jgi:hypothetical protein
VVARASTPRRYAAKARKTRTDRAKTAGPGDKCHPEEYLRASLQGGEEMRRGLFIVAAAAALIAVSAAYALLSQHGVKTTRLYERYPAAAVDGGTSYFAWSQNSRAHPGHSDAFLKRGSEARVKLNTKGLGYLGGIDPPMVAYQQVVAGNSNVKFYNSDTHARTNPPTGVNTSDWEWEPSISGDWLLFGRIAANSSDQRVILRSLTTATEVTLDQSFSFREPGQVNGDYAVWIRCDASCDVVRREISSVTDTVLQEPSATTYQYGAGVTSGGIVYVARSGKACGNAKIVRYLGASDPAGGTIVADLPNNQDIDNGYARENADGSVDFFYNRYLCNDDSVADIYRVHDPHPGP